MMESDTPDAEATLQAAFAQFGWTPPKDAAPRLLTYLTAILRCNDEGLNLTSVNDPGEALVRHLVDSLAYGLHRLDPDAPRGMDIADLGTGAGFPGVPLAFADPDLRVRLIDSRQKKIVAVNRALAEVGGPLPTTHGVRLRDYTSECGRVDVLVVRAVGRLEVLLREAATAVRPGGFLVAWKSDDVPLEERDAAAAEARRRRFTAWPDLTYISDRPRRLVRFRKDGA